jgi:hypothetical protein
MKIKLPLFFSLLPMLAMAQIPITTSGTQYTPQQLVTDVLLEGTGITAVNISSSTGTNFGSVNGLGYFTNGGGAFPLESGIILSTGDVSLAPGPNATIQSAGGGSWQGDADVLAVMQQVGTGTTTAMNATKLEFDFTAVSGQIEIDYVFAAEEYGFFQCNYSDAFVIQLTDISTGMSENIAVVPGTTIPVNVMTVRNNAYNNLCPSVNPQYFAEYNAQGSAATATNFNGRTVQMTAYASLIPGNVYHLKFAIADRNDTVYDSALFIESINVPEESYVTFAGTPDTQYACDLNLDGVATFNLTENDAAILDGQDPAEFTIAYFETHAGAEDNDASLVISDPGSYSNIATTPEGQTIFARLTNNANASFDVVSFLIVAAPQPFAGEPQPIIVLGDDSGATALVNLATQEAVILDGLDPESFEITYYTSEMNAHSGTPSISAPQAFFTASATLYFRLENTDSGCHTIGELEVVVLPSDYTTPAPDGDDEQQFENGDTLADLEVEGEEVQWYDNAGQAGPPNTNDTDTPLPLTTILVDGTTYYASQTVYGIESVQRLAVTVLSTMGAAESAFSSFTSFPNPVTDVLHITNKNTIETATIHNLMGQLVISTEINATSAQLNLSRLAKGMYFVTLKSYGAEKSIRIVKE